jgi:hypothetical protein
MQLPAEIEQHIPAIFRPQVKIFFAKNPPMPEEDQRIHQVLDLCFLLRVKPRVLYAACQLYKVPLERVEELFESRLSFYKELWQMQDDLDRLDIIRLNERLMLLAENTYDIDVLRKIIEAKHILVSIRQRLDADPRKILSSRDPEYGKKIFSLIRGYDKDLRKLAK